MGKEMHMEHVIMLDRMLWEEFPIWLVMDGCLKGKKLPFLMNMEITDLHMMSLFQSTTR